MLTAILSLAGVAIPSLFGWMRYREYLRTVRHVVNTLGADGLSHVDAISPPSAAAALASRRAKSD